MRRAVPVLIVLALCGLAGCGFGDDGGGSSTSAATAPAATTAPLAVPTQPAAPPAASTDVAPPDAIGRLAASFTAEFLVRQHKEVGLGPLACRDLAGDAGCIQLLSGGGACSSRFKAGGLKDKPDEFLATCVGGDNAWHCELDLQYFADGDRAGQAAYRDGCPAPDTASAKRLEAMLALATTWEVTATPPPPSTVS